MLADIYYHLIITIAMLLGLMALWLGLQLWDRRDEEELGDCDLLERRFGCHGCVLAGRCSREPAGDVPSPPSTS